MNNSKYTVLLPAFKAKFFSQALESIKNQTYQDFKCIVSDDCSPENLKEIYDEIVGHDPRFCYRRNEENMGSKSLVSHWNLLVDKCDTEFLIMASDDDVYESVFLEEIETLTNKYPHVGLYRGRVKKINGNNELIEQDFLLEEYMTQLEFLHRFFCGKLLKCVSHYVFKTEKLKENNGFMDFPLGWRSDDATAILLSANGVCNTSSIVFSFRSSGINISDMTNLQKEKETADNMYLHFIKDKISTFSFDSNNLYEKTLYTKLCSFLCSCLYHRALISSYKDMKMYYEVLDSMHFFPRLLSKVHFFLSWVRFKGDNLIRF